jgi:hypothetical protein
MNSLLEERSMSIRNRIPSPKGWIVLGMASLALSVALPRFLHVGEDLLDGVRGCLVGVALGAIFMGFRSGAGRSRDGVSGS